jgi:lathosterol oxidase
MEVILDHLDPVLLDYLYSSASRLAETICATGTDAGWSQLSPSSGFIDQSKQRLCNFATDPGLWQRHGIWRQSISIFFVTWLSSSLFYLLFGTVCYHRNFDRALKKEPKFRPNQIRSEMVDSLWALLVLNALTVPIFVAQVRGLARIYAFGTGSVWYEVAQYPLFVLFSDTCMYWLHRVFHHPVLFRMAHHKHHR